VKTKFDSVVKLKKQQVDNIEKNIQKVNASINNLKEKIQNLQNSIFSFQIPKSGDFALLNQIKHQQHILRNEIDNLKNQIIILENRKKELLNELKKANIEYEKMKYLQAEEIKKIVKEKRLKEARDMDEIAILLRKSNEPK
jgi:flagellar biosynthesis chaperone FliJ